MSGIRRGLVSIAALLMLLAIQAPAGATFPGGNGKIAFWAFNRGAIDTINPNGSGRTQVAAGSAALPRWSPDGTQIAFVNDAKSDKIQIIDAAGSNRTTVISVRALGPKFEFVDGLAWSPGGHRLAFCGQGLRHRRSVFQIFTVQTDGSGLKNISGSHRNDCDPDWSPSGSSIAFEVTSRSGTHNQIMTMNSAGANRKIIESGNGVALPSWSPDSSKLLFARIRHGHDDLAVAQATGGPITWITDTPKRWEYPGAWSPDGSKIVFSKTITSAGPSPEDLWVANANGSGPVRITDTPRTSEGTPDWQAT